MLLIGPLVLTSRTGGPLVWDAGGEHMVPLPGRGTASHWLLAGATHPAQLQGLCAAMNVAAVLAACCIEGSKWQWALVSHHLSSGAQVLRSSSCIACCCAPGAPNKGHWRQSTSCLHTKCIRCQAKQVALQRVILMAAVVNCLILLLWLQNKLRSNIAVQLALADPVHGQQLATSSWQPLLLAFSCINLPPISFPMAAQPHGPCAKPR